MTFFNSLPVASEQYAVLMNEHTNTNAHHVEAVQKVLNTMIQADVLVNRVGLFKLDHAFCHGLHDLCER